MTAVRSPGVEYEHDYEVRRARALERIAHALEHLAKMLDQVHHNPLPFKPLTDTE